MEQRVLFVGYTDDIVIPLCSRIFESMCRQKGVKGILVGNSGFFVNNSNPPRNLTLQMAGELGIDLIGYRSRCVQEQMTAQADVIIPMDESIYRGLVEYLHKDVSRLLKPMGISSPAEETPEAYRETREQIMAYCEKLVKKFKAEQKAYADFTVAAAEAADLDAVLALEQECFSHPWTKENLLAEWEKEQSLFVVAKNGRTVLGYGSVTPVVDVGYINNIGVTRKARGNGIATAILAVLEEHCKSENATEITLEVRSQTLPAVKLYQKAGFVQMGQRKGFYRDPDDDALILTKVL